ncbi:MAG TPA: tetratricopeptide repeat protein [Chthonomonadaceae bacterium]|nr:tetratricopeptide repeat protein [Chthonomonadaceae bacterium]
MSDLPTGTLTFLFTDIAGSTRLWDTQHAAMKQAHERQADLIAAFVHQYNGHLVRNRGEGDSTFSVFSSPMDALAAAAGFQRALHADTWPTDTPLRIRAALHIGPAELHWGDYNSTAVNRCARLRSLAAAGQTLVSQAIFEETQDHLPEGVTLRSLGSHRLKDLQRPELVYQLCHPDLPDDFAPLRSLDTLPTNLPQQLTRFIGRETEILQLASLLHPDTASPSRLLTLLGAGGAGKSRLAVQVGAELLEDYPDGVWLVELAAIEAEALVAQVALTAMGLRDEPGRTAEETLQTYLQGRKLLLVLDNCEHMVGACARLVEALLRSSPSLRVLATSREALNIPAETVWRIPSLSLPESGDQATREAIHTSEAVQLFLDRAQAASPHFVLTDGNASLLAQICRRLDGIPLALELAAARVRVLSVEQIAARLDDRFKLLTGGSRTALPRQQTLRALIDWSYALLSASEQELLVRLSVFAGGWTLEGAEQICEGGEIEDWEVLDLLTSLVDKSLVIYEDSGEFPRYGMLESIREYGHEKLTQSDQEATYLRRHGDYYSALAVETEPQLLGPEQARLLKELEAEHDNMRAVLARVHEILDGPEIALRLTSGFWRFWWMRGFWREGLGHLLTALENAPNASDLRARATTRNGAGVIATRLGDFVQARALLETALSERRQQNDRKGAAGSLFNLAHVEAYQGNLNHARDYYELSLEIHREFQNESSQAYCLLGLANTTALLGDHTLASERFESALALLHRLGDRGGEMLVLGNYGGHLLNQGDAQRCIAYTEQALSISRELNNLEAEGLYLPNLAGAAIALGEYRQAYAYLREALRASVRLGDKRTLAASLEAMAMLYSFLEEAAKSARLYGCTDIGYDRIALKRPEQGEQFRESRFIVLREQLGEERFTALWTEGQQLSMEAAVQEVLAEED